MGLCKVLIDFAKVRNAWKTVNCPFASFSDVFPTSFLALHLIKKWFQWAIKLIKNSFFERRCSKYQESPNYPFWKYSLVRSEKENMLMGFFLFDLFN